MKVYILIEKEDYINMSDYERECTKRLVSGILNSKKTNVHMMMPIQCEQTSAPIVLEIGSGWFVSSSKKTKPQSSLENHIGDIIESKKKVACPLSDNGLTIMTDIVKTRNETCVVVQLGHIDKKERFPHNECEVWKGIPWIYQNVLGENYSQSVAELTKFISSSISDDGEVINGNQKLINNCGIIECIDVLYYILDGRIGNVPNKSQSYAVLE